MSAAASPLPRLQRAIERRSLAQAEAAAREHGTLRLEDALALTLLMLTERDMRFERAVTRWLGRVLTTHPAIGLEVAGELAGSLASLEGASPDVARSRSAVLLRSVGLYSSAKVLERW